MKIPTSEKLFIDLCNEIDYYKEQAERFENLYNEEVMLNNENLNKSIKHSEEMIGNYLSLALKMEDTENGILIKKKPQP